MDESTLSSDYVSTEVSIPDCSCHARPDSKSVATVETEMFYSEDGISVDEGVVMMEDVVVTPVLGPANGSADNTAGDCITVDSDSMIENASAVVPSVHVSDQTCTSVNGGICAPSCHSNRDQVNGFYFQLIEVIVICFALLVVIVVFSIPTILFELPEGEVCTHTLNYIIIMCT